MKKLNKLFWALAAPVAAILFTLIFVSIILLFKGANPLSTFQLIATYGSQSDNIVAELNQTVAYYLAGVAAAIGFKMLLFNIGIDGQYRLAIFMAAVVGGATHLPSYLEVPLIILTGMVVGALWASISGYLKVKRNISEVISNIMLNTIASGLIIYLLQPSRLGLKGKSSDNLSTPLIPSSGSLPTFHIFGGELYSFGLVAIAVGILYWIVLNKSVFGFNLRATGMSFRAARASGVNAPRMVFITMALSGGIAGLTGMGELLCNTHTYSLAFPTGYALTGLALALLGRSNPIGIAIAAFFWSFLEQAAPALDLEGVPKEIVMMMQGTIILATVTAYEVVKRITRRQQQRLVGAADAPRVEVGQKGDK
ncbi:MAG: ABC transporter permease [Actinomycetes bacterium]|jgi:simple sugar transport system permease protein